MTHDTTDDTRNGTRDGTGSTASTGSSDGAAHGTAAPGPLGLFADLPANRTSDDPRRPGTAGVLPTVLTLRFLAVLLYRLSARAGSSVPLLGSVVKQVNHAITGADIAWSARIGPGLVLWHPTGVVIGAGVVIGRDARVQQGITLGAARSRTGVDGDPVLGDDVYVGAGARVLGPVRVGDRARVGANAVVLADVPDGASAVGVPARVVP
ncbi:serine O-acetyltransferase [Promicromonospora iranensis]|uniref:Serine O-acetyltransferase n=1 Tax=Promicromonospora iranensis TaxID=1105144 RepID=A0ABU2CR49_9MICO|nr:DapH/DapD/GlmU-related protein [Promicromonospora iranensis]MDR7383815.1 serine O-acetyltransferase [Promicromonospora iranensis]